jgi:hypothetical protein
LRRIDAEEVNRLASELDGQPYNALPVDDDSQVGRVPDMHEDLTAALNETGPGAKIFPPEDEPNDAVGGSVEERAILREEETR